VSIDFAYAQARAQAHVGERLPEAGWRVLESTLGLPQFLASARNTVLAPRVQHFSAAVTTHAIERALRDDWRNEVAAVSRWVPETWRPAVNWTAWLPYLESLAWLTRDEPALEWMRHDAVLAALALDDVAARRLALADSPFKSLTDENSHQDLQARWFAQWMALCPSMNEDETAGLHALVAAVRRYLDTHAGRSTNRSQRNDARTRLADRAIRLLHRHAEEPVVVFCYLTLVALDLQRLRDGLLRRALFRDESAEKAA
jgi:hypothetical protein